MPKKKPKKWSEVYPVGTKAGDEEAKFFRALARHPSYEWRSTSALRKESGLDAERVEEIIDKYLRKGMVFQSPKNEDLFAYWERVPSMLEDVAKNIAQVDQDGRIDKALSSTTYKFRTKLLSTDKPNANGRVYTKDCIKNWQTSSCVINRDRKVFRPYGKVVSTPSTSVNQYKKLWELASQGELAEVIYVTPKNVNQAIGEAKERTAKSYMAKKFGKNIWKL